MKHLRYDIYSAAMAGEMRHAQTVMKEFGIVYSKSIAQSMVDQWWFFDCNHGNGKLPKYISEMKLDKLTASNYKLPDNYIND